MIFTSPRNRFSWIFGVAVLGVVQSGTISITQAGDRADNLSRMSLNTTWDWILDSTPSTPPKVQYLGLDGFDTSKSYIRRATNRGTLTWCYLSIGTIENWRSDRTEFERLDRIERNAGAAGDYRQAISGMARRTLAQQPGLQGVHAIDDRPAEDVPAQGVQACRVRTIWTGIATEPGSASNAVKTLTYVRALATEAQRQGLVTIHKNATELAKALQPRFGAILMESCVLYDFCSEARPYRNASKPVFNVEYPEAWRDEGKTFNKLRDCAIATKAGANTIIKKLDLDDWIRRC